MKAFVFYTAGDHKEVLQLKDLDRPIINPSQVRIAVKARPVNPSDLFFIKGTYRRKPLFPQIAGLEGSGIIMETGSAVSSVQPGDHVAFRWPGTWAEEIAVDECSLIKIDKPLPFEISAQIGLNGLTAYALLEQSQLRSGDYMLIDAANSALAALIIQLAEKRKIRTIALVRNVANANELIHLGAAFVIAQDDPELIEKIERQVGKNQINCFIDAVGGEIISNVIRLMAPAGIILICGNMSGGAKAQFTNPQISYGLLTIKGFGIDHWVSGQTPSTIAEAYQEIIDDTHAGKILFKPALNIPLNQLLDVEEQHTKIMLTTL